jgi:hypothetical protein
MAAVTTLHLFKVAPAGVPAALWRMAADRRALRRTPGLEFVKLLGTGRGETFDVRDADLTLWGLLAVWSGPADLAAFERSSAVAAAWRRLAVERWRVDLRCLRSRGRWSGREPFGEAASGQARGPVAAITRARLRTTTAREFWRSVPPVNDDLHRRSGLVLAVGIGEAPLGLQGTFSLWSDEASLRAFAYGGQAHRHVIRRTAALGWYREELFARFDVLQSSGTLGGSDPLAWR